MCLIWVPYMDVVCWWLQMFVFLGGELKDLDPQNFSLMVVQHTYRTVGLNGTVMLSQHIDVVVVHLCDYSVIYRNCIGGLFN